MKRFPVYVALVSVSALFMFPFYWVVISALKSVPGMNLEPPSMVPAEQLTVETRLVGAKILEAEGSQWVRLARSPDLFLGGTADGAYYLQMTKDKPSSLVKWFPVPEPPKGVATGIGTDIQFPAVPVMSLSGLKQAVVAKMVRQTPTGFDELLFAADPAARLGEISIKKNVPHEDIRFLSAHWDNFAKALKGPEASIGGKSGGFLLFMRNSLMVAVLAVLGQILSSSLVAFGFSRMNFKGRDLLFVVLLATLMVPGQVTLIPLFSIYKSIGWMDSFLPLIVPQFTAGAFNVFLIRQFMIGLPRELDESAEIDGATPLRIFGSIVLPNCKPVLIVVGLFTFVAAWQDVMGPLIYLDNPDYRTVSLGLEYFRSPYVDNRPLLMAGALLSMLPVALLFLIAQRYILAGIATTGMKG